MPNAKTRKYIYGIIGTITPLLVTLGVLSNEVAGHLLAIAASILTLGGSMLAINNASDE